MAENVNHPPTNPLIQNGGKKCGNCGKHESQLANPLKRCAKCQQGSYCSRECQKADWKNHKKVCGKPSEAGQSSSNDLVATFNALPRPQLSPSGSVRNHWHFSIRHVPLRPPGDLLFLINPEARYVHTEGPAQLLPLSTVAERAALVVPMLMKAFTSGGMVAGLVPAPPLEAPWSWSTNDAELATAVEARLKEVGVREELRTVQVGNDEEDRISDEEWPNLLGRVQDATGSTWTAGRTSSSRDTPPAATGSTPTPNSDNPFHRLSEGKYLHSLSEQDAYCVLIDSYRLRVEDEFTFSNVEKEFSRYSDNPQPLQGFQRYLDRVEAKARLLPPWWSAEKRRACESLAQNRDQWSCIFFSAAKSDIIEFYKDSMKPMQLRIFAEEVEGWNTAGQGGTSGANIAAILGQTTMRG